MLTVSDAEKLVHAFMTSRLDYCNALLGSCPGSSINKLQIVGVSKLIVSMVYRDADEDDSVIDHNRLSNMIILLGFYGLCTGYLLSSVSATKYNYLPIRT